MLKGRKLKKMDLKIIVFEEKAKKRLCIFISVDLMHFQVVHDISVLYETATCQHVRSRPGSARYLSERLEFVIDNPIRKMAGSDSLQQLCRRI